MTDQFKVTQHCQPCLILLSRFLEKKGTDSYKNKAHNVK
jgi:hypothetical protein